MRPTEPGSLDMHTRANDPPIKVTREIPLHWLLSVLAAITGQAAIVYFTQQRQGDQLHEQTETIKSLTAELRSVTTDIGSARLKSVEHELKLSDHERRITALEKGTK